ncbi:MAG: double-strand break repair protein AddB [Pseudomonadota bacterium]
MPRNVTPDMTPGLFGETPKPLNGRVLSIPFGVPFLDTLADALITGHLFNRDGGTLDGPGDGPGDGRGDSAADGADFDLTKVTVLLPTRRAVRALQETFLKRAPGRALLLPELRPISDADEDASLISGLVSELGATDVATINGEPLPPAIDPLERQLLLAEMIQKWALTAPRLTRSDDDETPPLSARLSQPASDRAETLTAPSQAVRLAADLASLIDLVETERASLAALDTFVATELSAHWHLTLSILNLLLTDLPAKLAERRMLSGADRRNQLILGEAERIRRGDTPGPIVVAGVTGSVPATLELMRAVAASPMGAIVLPALDQQLDEPSFSAVRGATPDVRHSEHPQFGLSGVLDGLGTRRDHVEVLNAEVGDGSRRLRERVFSEAMRPASTTDQWPAFAAHVDRSALRDALRGLSLIAAPSSLDEAEVVALILRETLETPGKTAALVSPDRLLARRVAARLKAWNIDVDDSAGRPFRKTPPGALIDLILEVASHDFEAAHLVALLAHPLCRLRLPARDIRQRSRNLELAALRAATLGRGITGLRAAIQSAHDDVDEGRRRHRSVQLMRDKPDNWTGIFDLIDRLEAAFQPIRDQLARPGAAPLSELAAAVIATAEAVAEVAPPNGADENENAEPRNAPLWQGEDGAVASQIFARLLDPTLTAPEIRPNQFAEFYRAVVATETVRATTPMNPRLAILGPYEARLQSPDVVVLGGLNDGTWPKLGEAGPWLNRPMRTAVGIPQPEEEIGRAAHDFVTLCGAPEVYLTRAQKVDGAPTVPSRWLLRLQTVLAGLDLADALRPSKPWLAWAAKRVAVPEHAPCERPAPCPPIAARPKRLSVTDIETWIANPYAIFAKKILTLDPLDPIGLDPDAALRGSLVHDALSQFAERYPQELPADPATELVNIAREILESLTGHATVAAFWAPRFERFADWFAESEPKRRDGLTRSLSEVGGRLTIAGQKGQLVLSARADRIDLTERGIAIYDYKSGAESGLKTLAGRAKKLEAPQLPLEAAIARAGGFSGLDEQDVGRAGLDGLGYISTAGGEPPGADISLGISRDELHDFADRALDALRDLIDAYADEATPYRAIRRPAFKYDYDPYEQLARVKEWSANDREIEGGDGS